MIAKLKNPAVSLVVLALAGTAQLSVSAPKGGKERVVSAIERQAAVYLSHESLSVSREARMREFMATNPKLAGTYEGLLKPIQQLDAKEKEYSVISDKESEVAKKLRSEILSLQNEVFKNQREAVLSYGDGLEASLKKIAEKRKGVGTATIADILPHGYGDRVGGLANKAEGLPDAGVKAIKAARSKFGWDENSKEPKPAALVAYEEGLKEIYQFEDPNPKTIENLNTFVGYLVKPAGFAAVSGTKSLVGKSKAVTGNHKEGESVAVSSERGKAAEVDPVDGLNKVEREAIATGLSHTVKHGSQASMDAFVAYFKNAKTSKDEKLIASKALTELERIYQEMLKKSGNDHERASELLREYLLKEKGMTIADIEALRKNQCPGSEYLPKGAIK